MEELGSKSHKAEKKITTMADMHAGGSFGKVFKAIDRNTGETVAIKHVRLMPSWAWPIHNADPHRLISRTAAKSWPTFRPRFLS